MWSGTLDEIPDGWALCNGSSGTPDLTGRFIYGTAVGEQPGSVGGKSEHNHTYTQVPTHSHGITDPMHPHEINASIFNAQIGPVPWNICDFGSTCMTTFSPSSISVDYTGQAICETNNRTILPPYYELAFIMKADTNLTIPKGLIMMWPFPLNLIPENWILCNGSDNTPNITGRFAKCVENGVDPGTQGGYNDHNHTYTEVPRHYHTVSEGPGHQHVCNYNQEFILEETVGGVEIHSICQPGMTAMQTESSPTGITLDDAGFDICNTNNASNLPPYTEVAYIMCESDTSAAPHGVIGMWASSLASIPTKYALCDGITVPMNLTEKFALSVLDGVDPGFQGGNLKHNHTYTQIPRHTHSISISGTLIKWYKNGVHQSQFDGQTFIDAEYLNSGDSWYVIINGSDGIEVSTASTSTTVSVNTGSNIMDYLPYIVGVGVAILALALVMIKKRGGGKRPRPDGGDNDNTKKNEPENVTEKPNNGQKEQESGTKTDSDKSNSDSDTIIEKKANVCSICGKVIEGSGETCPHCNKKI